MEPYWITIAQTMVKAEYFSIEPLIAEAVKVYNSMNINIDGIAGNSYYASRAAGILLGGYFCTLLN